ncbi:MAG: hypothetical protein AB7V62_06050 [Thermoleophilia bacterium]
MLRRRRIALDLAAAGAAGALVLPALAAQDDLTLVSRAPDGAAAQGNSGDPAVAADGRLVAFTSNAANLSDADIDGLFGIHVRNMDTGTTALVSRASGTGAGADDDSDEPAISADGRVVVFSSLADNLATGEDEGVRNVFAYDRVAGVLTLVSRAGGPAGAGADGDSFFPAVSATGRYAAFTSDADNLSGDDLPGAADVFVRDLALGTTTLVSRATGPAGAGGDRRSAAPAISADGRLVAFASEADNLSDEDHAGFGDVFVRDVVAGTTTLASRATGPAGEAANGTSDTPSISADGRVVAFRSGALNLSDADRDPGADVFARDLALSTTTLVSRATGAAGAGGDADSANPAVSADGRFVAFESSAGNLSAPDANPGNQVLVRDLAAATTTLVSRAPGAAGAPSAAESADASISGDGRFVAFDSQADNLAGDDVDAFDNVFLRDVLGDPAAPSPPSPPAAGAPLTPTTPRIVRCAGRRATIIGTPRRDVIHGTRRADVIATLAGNDVVHGRGGNDTICLGAGNDRATGGPGRDLILGGAGRDRIAGGAGRDLLLGGPGRDTLRGGPGPDGCRSGQRQGCER